MKGLILILFISTSLLAGVFSEEFMSGKAYYKNKQYKEAEATLLPLAKAGDPFAQQYLGWVYLDTNNKKEALKWFRLSAEKSNPMSMVEIGRFYGYGWVVKKDLREGVRWFRKAGAGDHNITKECIRVYGEDQCETQ